MDSRVAAKLNKVLALTESAHDGEALAALRVTRSLLHQSGHTLSRLLTEAVKRNTAVSPPVDMIRPSQTVPETDIVTALQRDVVQLQKRLLTMQSRLFEQQKEINYWRNKAENTPEAVCEKAGKPKLN